jgi:hypothetical protein
MLKEGDDIGKSFVQRQNILVAGFGEVWVQSIQDGVGGFVGDDIVR